MSQIRLTTEERIQALERLGYTGREAAFLCQAALHGGYFLRRQFCQFLDKTPGGTAASLIEKAFAKGHAKGTTYATNTHIYHLCARPFYKALGQEDNRNRRLREAATIKNKLMGFDFVLEHPQHQYLATEQEKLDYFTRTRGCGSTLLPKKRYASQSQITDRYFVEKFPIFLSASSEPTRQADVTFSFVDEGAVGLSAFETFLEQYGALFDCLGQFGLIYVAATDRHFVAARHLFERSSGSLFEPETVAVSPATVARLLDHFESRRLHEERQWGSFDRAKLIKFRDARQEFSGEKFEALYRAWKAGGNAAVQAVLGGKTGSKTATRGTFSTYQLEHTYDFFGHVFAS